MCNSVYVTDLPTNREKYSNFNSPISGGNFCGDMIELAENVYLSGSSSIMGSIRKVKNDENRHSLISIHCR